MNATSGTSNDPIHQRFEEEKDHVSYDLSQHIEQELIDHDSEEQEEIPKKNKKNKKKKPKMDYDEDDLVNEIDSFLIEDDDI